MKQALLKKQIFRNKKIKGVSSSSGKNISPPTIETDNGSCFLNSHINIMGIQLEFSGKAEITPQLPEGWVMQGSGSRMVMFTLGTNPINEQLLFTYKGNIDINKVIAGNEEAKPVDIYVKDGDNLPDFNLQEFEFHKGSSNWEDYKSTKRFGKVKRTRYHLPNYDLPKVKKQIKKTIKTNYTRTFNTGSGGSGGY